MMELSVALLYCCSLLLMLASQHPVGAETSPDLPCRTVGGHNRVLDVDNSEMNVLMGYHRDTMEECLSPCCSQEWKAEVGGEAGTSHRHCNLVTFYEGAPEEVNNCFLVMCHLCSFYEEDGFQFAWVHAPDHGSSPHLPVIKNTNAAVIMPFIRHALPPSSSVYNSPSIQSQSLAENLPPQSARQQLSSWQLFKSAIAEASRGSDRSSLLRRKRRSVEKRAVENGGSTVKNEQPVTGYFLSSTATANTGEETPPKERAKTTVKPSKNTPTGPQEQPASSVQQQSAPPTPTQAVKLIIADDSVTLLPKNASTPLGREASSTQKLGEEPSSSTEKVTDQPASASTIVASSATTKPLQSTTKTETAAEKESTEGTEPEEGSDNTTATSQTQGEIGNAPTAQNTVAPEAGNVSTTSTPEGESSSAKLKVSTGADKMTVVSTSAKNEEGSPTTKPVTKEETPSRTPPAQEPGTSTPTPRKRTSASPVTASSTQKKVTEESKSSSTAKKITEKSGSASGGGDSEMVTDVIDVTEVMLETSPSAEDVPSVHNQFTFHTNNFLLILSLAIGIVLVIIVIFTLGKRWYEAYQRRHYNKVDYLINGS